MSPVVAIVIAVVVLLIVGMIVAMTTSAVPPKPPAVTTPPATAPADKPATQFVRVDGKNYVFNTTADPKVTLPISSSVPTADECEKLTLTMMKIFPDIKAWTWVNDGSDQQNSCFATFSLDHAVDQDGYVSGYLAA